MTAITEQYEKEFIMVEELSPKFVLGLIAGEASFNVALHDSPPAVHNVRPRPQMILKLKDNDGDVLRQCVDALGIGNYSESGGFVHWAVTSKGDCQDLAQYIHKHAGVGFKSTRKWKSFCRWEEVVDIVGDPYYRLSEDETLECIEIAKRVNGGNGTESEKSEKEWKKMVIGE